jgi:hypothetical protein
MIVGGTFAAVTFGSRSCVPVGVSWVAPRRREPPRGLLPNTEHDMGVLSAALFAVCRANLRCCIKTDLELILDDASLRNMIERWRSDARTTVLICMTSV